MSEAPLAEMAKNADDITRGLKHLGYRFANPIMSLSVLALSVAPKLRITDQGYVSVREGKLLGLFDCEEK